MISWRQKNRGAEPNQARDGGKALPDAELVRAARRGDKRAFVEIVARHQAMVCGIALGLLGDFAASEDAAQEAFLTAWRKFHDLREPEKLRPWLGQIARNAALGHLRRQRGHGALDEALGMADQSLTPDQAAATQEEAALVRDSLARLPENYRVPLILFYREGQSVRAVAEALAISEDAVKQRLARGREMLRDQMSGLIESVLTRTAPTAVFTMTIAAAIGALATPAAVAGGVFSATSSAAGTSSAWSSQVITAMSTTKTSLITAALVAAACIPVGYQVAPNRHFATPSTSLAEAEESKNPGQKSPPSFEQSAIFAEWRRLHETHGTSAEAMPALYDAIAAIRDPFRRRAFRAALISEWVQVDAAGGFRFFLEQSDTTQRRQFFQEWMGRDAQAAVDELMQNDSGWESIARSLLSEIARKVPSRVAAIAERLPKSNNYWDTTIRDAFAIIAEAGLSSARTTAEAMTGANREQALAGVAQAWARRDLNGAIAWAKGFPEGIDRDELVRAALLGKAAVDPVSALEQIGIVPPGGRQSYFATTTGARVLREAATADYDATVAWIAAHPGRLGREDLMGIARAVTDRLNADPKAFLDRHAADNTLAGIIPAIHSALLNESGGHRAAVWDWLKTQPEHGTTRDLREHVLRSAGYEDPMLALRMASDLPRTPQGDAQMQTLASGLFNGGQMMHRFDKLLEAAPERLQQPLIENAFNYLREDTLTDPQTWVARLSLVPETSRARAVERIAQAWGAQSPPEALDWAASLPPGETRVAATAAIASIWAAKDTRGAAEWIATLPEGTERDRSVGALARSLADTNPREAWDWALTIKNENEFHRAVMQTAQAIGARHPAMAREWIEAAPLTPAMKAQLQSSLDRTRTAGRP